MMGPDGRDCNNTIIRESSVRQLVLQRKGRTDSTFVCSASWIRSNQAERVGPTTDGGIVDGERWHGSHSAGFPVWGTSDELDRSHLKLNQEEGVNFSLKTRSSARAPACSPLSPNSAVRRSRASKHITRVPCF
jgi:hypothetical protein